MYPHLVEISLKYNLFRDFILPEFEHIVRYIGMLFTI